MEQALYELPQGWEWIDVVDLAFVKGGKRLPKGEKLQDAPTKHPYIRVADFTDTGGINTKGMKYITDDIYETIKRYTITHRDLYISIAGTIGKTGVIPSELDGANLTENAAKLVFKNIQRQDLFFIYYFTLSSNFVAQSGIATKTVAQPKLALTRLGKIKIPLPSLNEQKRIVTKLDALFTRIDTATTHLQQTLELSKALFASVLDEVFSPEKNKGKLVSLNQIATVARGKSKHRPRNDKTLFHGDYPFIQTGDVRNAEKHITAYSTTYNEKGLAQSKLWPKGTICLTIAANIGEVAILGMDACFPDSVVGISSDHESNDYIYYFLTTLQRHLDSKATMAAQKNINLRVLSDIEMPLPYLNEQNRIVTYLDALSEQTRALEAATQEKLNDLTTLKASLLDAAFKGQL